jgi:signal peptidase I
VTEPENVPEPPPTGKKPKKGSFWRELPILLGAAIVVAILVRTFVLQTFWIPSRSMEHTLENNDRVLVNKLVYDFRDPRRGEVIVFTSPLDWRQLPNQKEFIKRLIGVPGDHVVGDDQGHVSVNGVRIDQTFVDTDSGVESQPFDIMVPPDRLWVMGDNRVESADSRYHYENGGKDLQEATIPESSVIGRAFVLFWPFGRATWLSVPPTFANIPDPAGQ